MTLKELQSMIKEEFDAYMGEAEDDVDVSVSDNDVDAEMGDMEDETEEDVLRKIFDMLKSHFEGDEEGEDMDDMEDVEGEEAPDSDLDEAAAQGFGDPGNKSTSGKDAGYTPAKTTKGDGKLHEGFAARMKKLANIKG